MMRSILKDKDGITVLLPRDLLAEVRERVNTMRAWPRVTVRTFVADAIRRQLEVKQQSEKKRRP
jgi:hypothetical protein